MSRVFSVYWLNFEHVAPVNGREESQGVLAFRRALALRNMGKLRLSLLEIEQARTAAPDDPQIAFVYLDLLRQEDLPAAVAAAEKIVGSGAATALVLVACINILALHAEQVASDEFEDLAPRVLDWCRRLDQAPDRDQAGASLVALSCFNRGIVHLRAGRVSKARAAFENAQRIYPVGPVGEQLASLETYDHHAREVARRVRAIAERWVPTMTVAA